jgi:ribosomal protein S18 acetylase RimI-like enzyme
LKKNYDPALSWERNKSSNPMRLTPRPYRDFDDFRHLDAILNSGGRAAGNPYYVHPGDLRWWLFYTFSEDDAFQGLTLWEDEHGHPAALTLFSQPDAALDVYCLPEIHASPELKRLVEWGVKRMMAILRQTGEPRLFKWWTHPEDQAMLPILDALGFAPSGETTVILTRSLGEPLPPAVLPPAFKLRSAYGLVELENRAAAQHSAFKSELPMDRYLQRFHRYMSSPVYNSEQDVVVEAPDGCIVAFARIWIDPVTRIGNFEPVGTHGDYQRRGLGRAVMLEGLRRMQAQGMTMAKVGTGATNTPAIRLYETAGFQITVRLPTYTCMVE